MSRRLYDYAEAAEELRVLESWLRNNIRRLPHIKIGGTVFFTDADLDRILTMHHIEPEQAAQQTPISENGAPALTDIQPLPLRRRDRATA